MGKLREHLEQRAIQAQTYRETKEEKEKIFEREQYNKACQQFFDTAYELLKSDSIEQYNHSHNHLSLIKFSGCPGFTNFMKNMDRLGVSTKVNNTWQGAIDYFPESKTLNFR